MKVEVTERPVVVEEPPKTYDVWFKGLTRDEAIVLRQALSPSEVNRSRITNEHLRVFAEILDPTVITRVWIKNSDDYFSKGHEK